jgi:dTDP-4-dehydrorhamnose reductase
MFRKVLVTGSNGQLGTELRKLEQNFPKFDMLFTDVEEMDITKPEAINAIFSKFKPNLVINCAAYTAVDKAEEEKDLANNINGTAPHYISQACKNIGAKFIHFSTDYVFDGSSYIPYAEGNEVSPSSAYGESKLMGEKAVLDSGIGMVIRTSWLYSTHGNNFLKTILNKSKSSSELNVVFDQIGSPTWANDLAQTVLTIASMGKSKFVPELFHYSNEGVCSWYDFAVEICAISSPDCKINAILSQQYPTKAKRPHYSVLNKSKIKAAFGIEIPHWRSSLKDCLASMDI